jgi:hypothetical protein
MKTKPRTSAKHSQRKPIKQGRAKPKEPRNKTLRKPPAAVKPKTNRQANPPAPSKKPIVKKRKPTKTQVSKPERLDQSHLLLPGAPPAIATKLLPTVRQSFEASAGSLVTALALWVLGLLGMDPTGLNDYGIVSILTPPIWAALVLMAVGFAMSLRRELASGPLPLLHLSGLVIVLHATPAFVYETARYSWAWKHLGIVDFIQRRGTVDQTIDILPAYHNWPGLFLATAWLANTFGIKAIDLANAIRFVPPVLNLLYLFALLPIYRRFTEDSRLIWTAAWIFLVGNWIGQDYFSPQGVTFFLYLVVLGLCLGPLQSSLQWTRHPTSWIARHAAAFASFASAGSELKPQQVSSARRMAAATAVLLMTCAIVISHQLTPVALILALAGLAAIGRVSISFCIFALVAETLWLLYFATPFVASHLAEELASFGLGLIDASDRLIDTSLVTQGQVWVVIIGRLTTAVIALTALIGGLRRLANGYRDGPAAVLAVSAFPLFANSYGGEILFRVYLFALPFLAFFAAAAFFPAATDGHSRLRRTLLGCFGLLLAVGFLFANNGKDREYTFSKNELGAAQWLYSTAPPGTLLIEGARSYPAQFLNYENFTYLPLSREGKEQRIEIVNDPVDTFARWLGDPQWKAGYVIITRSQKAYSDAEGIMPLGSLDKIEQALLASPRFEVVYASPDARIFTLHPKVGKMGPWAR